MKLFVLIFLATGISEFVFNRVY